MKCSWLKSFDIENFLGPFGPRKFLNPPNGTNGLPVANIKKSAFSESLSVLRTSQNQRTV
jgi:hypothetical protein